MIPKEPSDATRSGGFPQFPGEEVLSHAAALFLEKAEAPIPSAQALRGTLEIRKMRRVSLLVFGRKNLASEFDAREMRCVRARGMRLSGK